MSTILTITTKAAATQLAAIAAALDVKLPRPVAQGFDHLDTLATKASEQAQIEPHAIADAVADALDAGRDVDTDEAVRRALTRQHLLASDISVKMDARAEKVRLKLLREHAPAIIETWRPIVDQADEAFENGRRVLGARADLDNPRGAMTMSPAELTAWHGVREAEARLIKVINGWTMLATVTRLVPINASHRALILADLSSREHEEVTRKAGPVPALVYRSGAPLDLATLETFAARVDALAHTREQVRAEREARANAQRRADTSFAGV